MRIIGVIDVLGGRAVHAKGGCRHSYRPIDLADGVAIDGDPIAVARMYRHTLGLDELYVADLDAIAGGAEQDSAVRSIATVGRNGSGHAARLWLDAGASTPEQARGALSRGATHVVVGLETLPSFAALREIADVIGSERVVFSLDLRDGRPVTDSALWRDESPAFFAAQATEAGARSIIILDLARVGSGRGVDIALLEIVRRAAPGVAVFVGGGVRGTEDLCELASAGCDGALVATALQGPDGIQLVRCATSLVPAPSR